jgi:cell division protein ZapA
MATVNVEVNGRIYPLGCEDGQEAQLTALAVQFDAQVRQVAAEVGQVGEHRLLLMAALMNADELAEAQARAAEAEAALAQAERARQAAEARAARVLDEATRRIEAMGR